VISNTDQFRKTFQTASFTVLCHSDAVDSSTLLNFPTHSCTYWINSGHCWIS